MIMREVGNCAPVDVTEDHRRVKGGNRKDAALCVQARHTQCQLLK